MANADFSQNDKQTAPGGFDAGSYREKAKPEQTVKLTPRQQKLAALEAKLPAALSTRAAALAVPVTEPLAAMLTAAGKWQISDIHITDLLDIRTESHYNAT